MTLLTRSFIPTCFSVFMGLSWIIGQGFYPEVYKLLKKEHKFQGWPSINPQYFKKKFVSLIFNK